jgi:drug/metabolite transporter (DMT)-like permease
MGVKLEMRRLIPVIIATLGVIIVVYGGSTSAPDPQKPSISLDKISRPSAPLVGDLLTLVASVIYALYQVLYKKYAALPSDPELHDSDRSYEQLVTSDSDASPDKGVYPPPFGLYPNLVTSLLGLATFLLLGVFIPVLHYTGVEPFRLPPDLFTLLTIVGIAVSGVMFNAGYMVKNRTVSPHSLTTVKILLGLWGPVITSVGGLLTIVLVFVSDLIFGMGGAVSLWSILGSTAIIAAFGILSYDMLQKR